MPVYLLWGDEDFLLEAEIKKIKDEALNLSHGGEQSPLNYRCFDNPDYKTLIDALRMQPMMFGNIVCKIRADKYFLETTKKIKLEDKQTDEVINALQMVSDRVFIILTCPIDKQDKKKPDSRKKIYKAVQKAGTITEFSTFKPYDEDKVLPVLKTMVKKQGLKADTATLYVIIRKTGVSLRDLNSALEKIKLIIHPKNIITKDVVEKIGKDGQNIFLITDLLIQKKFQKALYEISSRLDKSHPLEILAFLQGQISKLLMTKIYSNSMSPFEIARKTGQNDYAVKKSLEKLSNSKISADEIARIKQNLTQAEYEIKTGAKEPLLALEYALLNGNGGDR